MVVTVIAHAMAMSVVQSDSNSVFGILRSQDNLNFSCRLVFLFDSFDLFARLSAVGGWRDGDSGSSVCVANK